MGMNYEKLFEEWVNFYGIHEGSLVRVQEKCASGLNGWDNIWISDMDNFIGKIARVESNIALWSLHGLNVNVEMNPDDTYGFPFFVLEAIDREVHPNSPIWPFIKNMNIVLRGCLSEAQEKKYGREVVIGLRRISSDLENAYAQLPSSENAVDITVNYHAWQTVWLRMNDIKIRDKILVSSRPELYKCGWDNDWDSSMDLTVGSIGTVVGDKPTAAGICVYFDSPINDWGMYPLFCLLPIKREGFIGKLEALNKQADFVVGMLDGCKSQIAINIRMTMLQVKSGLSEVIESFPVK